MNRILIVGAGFSGTAIAAQLLRHAANNPMCIYLINSGGPIARGMAYGTQSPAHVLNVPAGNMSAFVEDPSHFVRFAQTMDASITEGSFVSRRIYGDYLEFTLGEAERNSKADVELIRIYKQVIGIDANVVSGDGSLVTLENGEVIEVDKVILAPGHFASNQLPLTDMSFYGSERYVHDPWDYAALDRIPARAPVLLLGSGLTAVDVAITLLRRNPIRKITMISRRGLLPQAHRHIATAPLHSTTAHIWAGANTVRTQMRALRKYCRLLTNQGRDWREALAILRPVTAAIWQSYSEKERRRFCRHVQPFWDTHRHRIAPLVAEQLFAAVNDGVISTLAGRISGLSFDGENVQATLRRRGLSSLQFELTQYVVNCTGPCSNPRQVDAPLMQQLLGDGILRPDKLGLGIDVAPDCAVVAADGQVSQNIFYIGPWLKARYWEATAVPDLRVIAIKLAQRIVLDISAPNP